MPSVVSSGAQAATISTEHTLDTLASADNYLLVVDLTNLVGSDTVELTIYGKCRTGDAEAVAFRRTYGPTALAEPLVSSIPISSPHHMRATLKQIAGTGRTYPWAIYSVA